MFEEQKQMPYRYTKVFTLCSFNNLVTRETSSHIEFATNDK